MLHKRDPMGFSSNLGGVRVPSRKVSARSLNTVDSELSLVSVRSSRSIIRQAGNLLPHNRNRRWMDEAGDMLTVPPSLQDSAEGAQVDEISEALKRKEWERSEKWRKMAKLLRGSDQGQGMEFEFDARNPKLIERTWKGIPDRWRAAAWWSFMASAAKEHDGSAAADDIVAAFHDLQEKSSPDDVQIDLDVPRTISRHIMFRRRYRGGQRLLFRVLHAVSIYFPDVGYVQGMASLAATLLCYFDEEKCFVMLVRMWQLRGLGRLYRPGFDGLMAALGEFETGWLNKGVADKLVSNPPPPLGARSRGKTNQEAVGAVHRRDGLRHAVVPDPVQLVDTLSRPAPGLGRVSAARHGRQRWRRGRAAGPGDGARGAARDRRRAHPGAAGGASGL